MRSGVVAGRGGGASPGGAGIARAVASVRRLVVRRFALAVAAWCAGAMLALLALAPILSGSRGWGAGSPVPLAMAGAAFVVMLACFAWWRRLARRWGADHRVTRAMDAVAGLNEGQTLGSLELSRSMPPGTSPALRKLALRLTGERLGGDAGTLSGALGDRASASLRRGLTAVAVAAPLVLLVALPAPGRALSAWTGLLNPFAVLAAPVLPPVSVEPGTAEVARGAVVEVVVRAPLRDSAMLRWEATGQVAGAQGVRLTAGEGRASLPPATAETRYWAETADGARSPLYVLSPVDPLFVASFVLEATYPPHTGIAAAEYRDEAPPLAVPAGTVLSVRGRGSRAIGSGALVDAEGQRVLEFRVEGDCFEGRWAPERSGAYAWQFEDVAGGAAATAPPSLLIEVAADRAPRVEIAYPGPDTLAPLDLRQPLVVRVEDDHGVRRVEIVARRITAFGEAGDPVARGVELGSVAGAVVRPVLDMTAWGLSPGDAIRYFARAVDNHPSSQVARTAEHVLRMPGTAELERAAHAELEGAAERVEALSEEAGRGEDAGRVGEEAAGSPRAEDPGFRGREEAARAMERQNRVVESVDSLRRELARLREALRDAGLADPELRDRIEGLEALLEEAAAGEDADDLAAQADALAEMDPRALREAMEGMAEEQERLRRRLEESVAQFRQAALDQDFQATGREAEDLAEEQALLAEAMRAEAARAEAEPGGEGEGDPSLRAEQQAELEAEASRLQERLEMLQQRLAEAGEQDAGAGVQEARHQLSQARQQMARAAAQAAQGQSGAGAEQAQQAAGDMSQVAQRLDDARMQMQQQMMQALRDAVGRTAVGALALARRQSELLDEIADAPASELAALRGDEAAIAQGIQNLVESYAAETEMAAPGARDLLTAAGQAMEHVDGAIRAMESRRGRGRSPAASAEAAVRSLNEVARLAIASGQQGQAQGSASASASEQMMQQLQQLAQAQGEIMQDAASLSPMQLAQETLARQMEEMAGRQEEVAQELGDVAEDGRGEEADPLGDLSALADEARRLAEAMAEGRLDPEVLRRQERLFHRLLDAGRTLERDEESEDRESETPGAFVRASAGPLDRVDVDALRYRLPGGDVLRALPPAQRAMVVRYFQRLNGGDPPAWSRR